MGRGQDPRGAHRPAAALGREELGTYLAGRPHAREALVFTVPRGGPLRDLLPEELRLYDLRHTAASLMICQGASVKAVQRQLGHATASITLDVYGHLFPDQLDALAGRLEDARAEARASIARTQRGPAVVQLREGAGQ